MQDLQARFPETNDRRSLFDLLNVSMLLSDSIIKKDYQVPTAAATLIQLTEYGLRIFDALRKRQVPYHDARLICFLEIYHNDLIVDIAKTDTSALIRLFDRQVADGSMKFPMIFGRELYDKYYEHYAEDAEHLFTADETQKFLEGTPQGVYQYGRLVTGPYGIARSRSSRLIPANHYVPVRHCADLSCGAVHSVHLSTNTDASINKHRLTMSKILEREASHGTAWPRFMDAVASEYVSSYMDWAAEPVVILIGDALDQSELRRLLQWLVANTNGVLSEDISRMRAFERTELKPSDLNRAQILQLILLANNEQLIMGIDTLVRRQLIEVPPGEIRRPVLNISAHFGRHNLRASLGPYGVRVDSTTASLAPLRAKELVQQMYRMEDEADRSELDWQLRDEASDSLEAKLEHYLQTRAPEEALGKLILSRRNNVVVAATRLGLGDIAMQGDDVLRKAIMWKLGFSIRTRGEIHDEFWRAHEAMLQEARQGTVNADSADREDMRLAVANYSTSLERLLQDSLGYSVWALCTDHHAAPKPYVYRPHIDRDVALKLLDDFEDRSSDVVRMTPSKTTLARLTRGFAKLSRLLADSEERREDYARPAEELPDWMQIQSLEKFPFVHKMAYLDLLPDCRTNIRRVLDEITARFLTADFEPTRDLWLRGQRSGSAANLDRLREGLDDIREAVISIEENGFSRQIYGRVTDTIDGDGRRTIILANTVGRQIELYGPSPFSWLRLPGRYEPQYVMNIARFAEPAECLRFVVEVESAYSRMWNDYPKRPRLPRGKAGLPVMEEGLHT